MLAKLKTLSLLGIEAMQVEVEVDVSSHFDTQNHLSGASRSGGEGEHAATWQPIGPTQTGGKPYESYLPIL